MSYLNPMHGPTPCWRRMPSSPSIARRIDNGRAGAPEIVDGAHEDVDDLGIGRVALVRLTQDADARAAQAVAHQRGA